MAAHEDEFGESAAVLPICRSCKQVHVPPRPDACLGLILGVTAADCGHGRSDHAWVVFVDENGAEQTLYAEDALAYFRARGVGPFGDATERARLTT